MPHPRAGYMRSWQSANAPHLKEYRSNYQRDHRERIRASRHGLTLDQLTEMLAAQGGACAICRRVTSKKLHIDHNHATGEIRGLLCSSCNRAIGLLVDNPALFDAAAEYLRRTPRRRT